MVATASFVFCLRSVIPRLKSLGSLLAGHSETLQSQVRHSMTTLTIYTGRSGGKKYHQYAVQDAMQLSSVLEDHSLSIDTQLISYQEKQIIEKIV